MNFVCLVLACFLALIAGQGPSPSFPPLAPAFLVNVEANLIDMNKTVNLREFYDLNAGMARYEINTVDSFTTVIVNFKDKMKYTIVNDVTCDYTPWTSDAISSAQSAEDIFVFGAKFNETYLGVFEVRGVPCDSWISRFNFVSNGTTFANGTNVGSGTLYDISVQYYFTVEAWSFRAVNVTRKPMRAVLNGTKTTPSGVIAPILHYYEFVNFVPKTPLPSMFQPPNACVGVPGQLVQILQSAAGASLATGMFFFGLFLGAIITGVSIWGYCRRRQMLRDKFTKTGMSERTEE